jgi:NAD(P)-dependent dehydrogenase (short-subunit alcohol dehydrogenase family)
MSEKLPDKVAILTGAGIGFGRNFALALAREGAHMVLAARRRGPLEETARAVAAATPQCRILLVETDVQQETAVQVMVQRTLEEFGTIDILINNAGITGPVEVPLHEIDSADWDAVQNTNLRGTFLCCKAVLPTMIAKRSGKVINISGTSGLRGYINRAAYSSSKWAVRGLTRTLALEAGPYNINVNAICPGVVSGGRMDRIMAEKARLWGCTPQDVHDKYVQEMALRRFTEPEDVANAVIFLASEDSRAITGQALAVDGGWDV